MLLDTLAPPDSIVSRPRVHFAKMTVSRWCKLHPRRREMQLWALAPGCVSISWWKFIRCAIVSIFAHEHPAASTAPIEIVLNYCDLGPKWSHLPNLAKLFYCGTWQKNYVLFTFVVKLNNLLKWETACVILVCSVLPIRHTQWPCKHWTAGSQIALIS